MKQIICKDCGNKLYRSSPAKFCFECITKHERDGERERYTRNIKGFKKECIFCQKELEQIHHADLNPKNNNSKNLIPLCLKCHKKIHYLIIKPILKAAGAEPEKSERIKSKNYGQTYHHHQSNPR